jgi:hypothetical protein
MDRRADADAGVTMAARVSTISLTGDFDVEDVLDQISDEDIAEEAAERGLFDLPEDVIKDAMNAMPALASVDGIERWARPKWKSKEQCQAEYERAMGWIK